MEGLPFALAHELPDRLPELIPSVHDAEGSSATVSRLIAAVSRLSAAISR
jgi:hypothetical protein